MRSSARVAGPRGLPVVLALLVAVLTGCASDQERYCGAVEDRQGELSDLLASGGDAALIDALDVFRDLADEAPPDIRDEWALVNDRIATLADALAAAGVDPASYDAEEPPARLGAGDRVRIEDAARGLGARETQEALAAVEQQALDVCQTPLSI